MALECRKECLCVDVNNDKTPLLSGIIKINEPLEKLITDVELRVTFI